MVKQLKKVPYCGRPQGPLPPSPLSAFDLTPPPLSLWTSFMDGPQWEFYANVKIWEFYPNVKIWLTPVCRYCV